MGCDYYNVASASGRRKFSVHFSDMCDEYCCLCTFPHNNEPEVDAEIVRSLALLGAALVLAHKGEYNDEEDGYVFLPDMVPDWIRQGIDKVVPPREDRDGF